MTSFGQNLNLHILHLPRVKRYVTRIALWVSLAVLPIDAASTDLGVLLKGVEQRYNHAKTLQVQYNETYTVQGQARKSETGTLTLRKPGRMRWDYTAPAGKLFLSDGKDVYLYTPESHRAEKEPLKASEDMRAPMAFLLGKLDFAKEFRNFELKPEGTGQVVIATAKSDKLPYTKVEMLVSPEYEIRRLVVNGQDGSILTFLFDQEKLNPPVNEARFKFQLPAGAQLVSGEMTPIMAEFVLKYSDPRGEVHSQVAEAGTEKELRDRYSQQGFLIYSIKPRHEIAGMSMGGGRKKKINLEKFLIFNQQFVTLVRAGLPILKALDLLSDRLTDMKLAPHIKAVREEVRNGSLLSDAFARQGVFPPIYVTSVLAGEKSGALGEVLDRFITYQKLALAVRKKLILSLVYPCILIVLVVCLMIFLITFVVPKFAELYSSMSAKLPAATEILIAVGTTARNYILFGFGVVVIAAVAFRFWAKTEKGEERMDRWKLRTPVLGEIWIKYQVAQFARVLGTLLVGGIPLMQALDTASSSLGTRLLKRTLGEAGKMVKEGQSLSSSLTKTKVFPGLAIDMIEVGESTGALPQMLQSVAEFYEDDVNTRMSASLALIEPAIMLSMGAFVTFVLVALYLPIFSLADTLR